MTAYFDRLSDIVQMTFQLLREDDESICPTDFLGPVFKCLDRYAMDMLLQSRSNKIPASYKVRSKEIGIDVLVQLELWQHGQATNAAQEAQAFYDAFAWLVSNGHDLGHAIATQDRRNSDSPRFNGLAYILYNGKVMTKVDARVERIKPRGDNKWHSTV